MSTHIVHLIIELYLPHAHSLKEKRACLRKVKDKITHQFNVSLVESDYQDKWQRSKIEIAIVGTEITYLENLVRKIPSSIEALFMGEILIIKAEANWHS